ncbi:uncharacterized protein LOC125381054 [Haliotis rufescens]|uniref:uncharacterized protein LOC125381051 n=1 Tax=Haliotis rufescens TaxID=6454 RepID=UPI00201F1DF8|nr:uncharacterized protein LOC125381051 [Haliotis rufescens]XP_048253158.1 uncharacterized protein LOC125381053 [Haliotis rufescens]XP_048253159.1 uncharacterized protein LOC125381054 [Haliotis rufescens]
MQNCCEISRPSPRLETVDGCEQLHLVGVAVEPDLGHRLLTKCDHADHDSVEENEALPIYMYMHTNLFHAVVGGYVYRGRNLLDLYGRYLYGDAMTGAKRPNIIVWATLRSKPKTRGY